MPRLKTYKRARQGMYAWARTMGNWQPFLEMFLLDPKAPRKIVRRQIHRGLGRVFSKQLFGGGVVGRLIKLLVGL